jgi:hypothetical protein
LQRGRGSTELVTGLSVAKGKEKKERDKEGGLFLSHRGKNQNVTKRYSRLLLETHRSFLHPNLFLSLSLKPIQKKGKRKNCKQSTCSLTYPLSPKIITFNKVLFLGALFMLLLRLGLCLSLGRN